jgi:hypothetical protein
VYASTAALLPAAIPGAVAAGGSAAGGGILELNVGSGMNGFTTRYLSQTFITSSPGQNALLNRLFNSGIVPTGLTLRAAQAYLELAQRYLTRTDLTPAVRALQEQRVKILLEAIKHMQYP